jgi:radical SAM superfamily enzyme YgiQ (UPF0313 family)
MLYREIENMRRRLAGEQGTIIKGWGGKIPVALVYPSSYYIGMSNLGVHAIYKLLNGYDNIVCERAFWEKGSSVTAPVVSIESVRPLSDFAVIAMSITYELDYFNIPLILKSCGIPVYAADRNESHPLVIAGGPVVMANPAPIAPFFDAVCIGEAEPLIPAIAPVFSEIGNISRDELLKKLADIPGIYVPKFYSGTPIVRQYAENLDTFPVSTAVVTRDTDFGDMYMIEVERGCNWRCRFCLVGNTFSPMRYRSLDIILEQAGRGLKFRKRIGLVGPDVSDYPHLEELITRLWEMGAEISISSLRVKPFSPVVLQKLVESGAKTITIAPEAGSDRMRRIIAKGITPDDIFGAITAIAKEKVKELKLYFMIGLPEETDEDVAAIASLVLDCKRILNVKSSGTRLSITVSPFVPKAGTPWERLPMADLNVIKARLTFLKSKLPEKGVSLHSESPTWSEVQAALARGDSSFAPVIVAAGEVSLPSWQRALRECQVDVGAFAHRKWADDEKLPWDVIDLGGKKIIQGFKNS